MKILVTGGTGFVGPSIVQAFRAAGREVRVLARDPRARRSSPRRASRWSPAT